MSPAPPFLVDIGSSDTRSSCSVPAILALLSSRSNSGPETNIEPRLEQWYALGFVILCSGEVPIDWFEDFLNEENSGDCPKVLRERFFIRIKSFFSSRIFSSRVFREIALRDLCFELFFNSLKNSFSGFCWVILLWYSPRERSTKSCDSRLKVG